MNRADRLRKVAPGASPEALAVLSALPADQVAQIASFARQARRDALDDAAERKRRRRADDRTNANYDEADYARRNLAVIASQGQRAKRGSLDALTALGQVRDHVDTWLRWAVEGCRAEGLSDTAIGEALGFGSRYARQEVHRRYGKRNTGEGRRQNAYTDTASSERLSS